MSRSFEFNVRIYLVSDFFSHIKSKQYHRKIIVSISSYLQESIDYSNSFSKRLDGRYWPCQIHQIKHVRFYKLQLGISLPWDFIEIM
jgi:predicted N-acyltransferase